MKRSLLVAATALLTATTAHASSLPLTKLYTGPYWSVVYASSANSCVLSTAMSTPVGEHGMVTVKYFANTHALVMQIFKSSWRFPEQGVSIPVAVWFDGKQAYAGSGMGYPSQTKTGWPYVGITVKPDVSKDFMDWFAAADVMAVQFTQGNEPPWKTTLIGSREATTVFAKCIVSVSGAGATQPYGSAGSAPTQPYSGQPAPKKSRAPMDDDGAI